MRIRQLKKCIGIDKFGGELVLVDRKENLKLENNEKIQVFCSLL